MDYKELAEMCRYLSDTPSYTAFHDEVEREVICDSCKGGLCYEKVQDAHWCMYEALQRAATAITDLLARAEAAEKERDEEKSKVDEYADSARAIALWLAGFCDRSLSYPQMISNAARKIALAYADMEKRAEAAEARADKAERERDEAMNDIPKNCHTCTYRSEPECAGNKRYRDFGFRENCEYWQWRGKKED